MIRTLRLPAPMTRSPSQWPGTARSSASGGRALMRAASIHERFDLRGRPVSGERDRRRVRPERRALSTRSCWRRDPAPWT